MGTTDLDAFMRLARSRRATRRFKPDPLPEGLLDELIEAARWAPSGYNLQPTRFIVVTDPAAKARMRPACLGKPQIEQAPAVVVFCGDRQVVRHNLEPMIALEKANGSMTPEYEATMRRFIGMAFGTGPLGLGWLAKALIPLARPMTRVPSIPAVHRGYWLGKQAGLCAMAFMLAAAAAGLNTGPMEGFDHVAVRKALGLPKHLLPIIVVTVGYGDTPNLSKTRLPLEHVVQHISA